MKQRLPTKKEISVHSSSTPFQTTVLPTTVTTAKTEEDVSTEAKKMNLTMETGANSEEAREISKTTSETLKADAEA